MQLHKRGTEDYKTSQYSACINVDQETFALEILGCHRETKFFKLGAQSS